MPKYPFAIDIKPLNLYGSSPKVKKRKTLTARERIYIWERPNIYGRTCSICHGRINKLSDLELDHTKAYSKGGVKLALAHRECNRLKSSGSLRRIQERLGIKSKTKKTSKKAKKNSTKRGNYWINPITGKKEKIRPLFDI